MRRFEPLLAFLLLSFLFIAGTARAEYWFQVGARGGSSSSSNNGASVEIQTVLPQNVSVGTMGFWTGENLPNGAFLQVGYVVENQSGTYPTNCTRSGCGGTELLKAGDAEWFYEYFIPGSSETFLGSIGPDGSAGSNGVFNTYSFYSLGSTWYFQFNNKTIGSVDLGVSDSGPYSPLGMGEFANTTGANFHMNRVIFANLSAYKYDMYLPVSEAYGAIGYGVGSRTYIKNPYGVQEIGDRINYFEVGSGLPQYTNNTKLWTLGYKLKIMSKYGNLSSGNSYTAYSSVRIATPAVAYFSNFSRAVFQGWSGTGIGSYSGSRNSITVNMDSNITETALWQVQNFVNVTSLFGNATGTGWYANGSTAYYGLSSKLAYQNGKPRFVFSGWSNGNGQLNGSVKVSAPVNLTAKWQYKTMIFGKDAYGETLIVPSFLIDGQHTNSTPFLNANNTHQLEGAYYKQLLLPLNYTITGNTSETLFFTLPVYNVSINTRDFFGLPVNVSAIVSYQNYTQTTIFSGANGTIRIPDVPYGYASFVFDHLGIKSLVIVGDGRAETTSFISSINIGTAVLAAMLLLYLLVWRHRSRPKRQIRTQR